MSARLENLVFQNTTRCHSVFSCFSPAWFFHWRLVAMDSVATPDPVVGLRTSGSAPRFPTRMALFILRLTCTSSVHMGPTTSGCGHNIGCAGNASTEVTSTVPFSRMLLERKPKHQRILLGVAVVRRPLAHRPKAGA